MMKSSINKSLSVAKKTISLILGVSLFFIMMSSTALAQPATVHWTVSIVQLRANLDGRATVLVENPLSSNPSDSPWNCTDNLVSLGSAYKDDSNVSSSLIAAATTAISINKPVRMTVIESDGNCQAAYIKVPHSP